MKIYIIRHAKVKMRWPKSCNSFEFDNACSDYDNADIVQLDGIEQDIIYKKVYVSKLSRSIKTAQALFPNVPYEVLDVEEVPLKSFIDSSRKYPLWVWNIMGRIQWFCNNRRQPEIKIETVERCIRVIRQLEERDEDCIIFTHGFFMKSFIKFLKKKHYSISGNKINFNNLQIVIAENM